MTAFESLSIRDEDFYVPRARISGRIPPLSGGMAEGKHALTPSALVNWPGSSIGGKPPTTEMKEIPSSDGSFSSGGWWSARSRGCASERLTFDVTGRPVQVNVTANACVYEAE